MKHYKSNSSKIFFLVTIGNILFLLFVNFFTQGILWSTILIFGTFMLAAIILSLVILKSMVTEFRLSKNEIHFRTGYEKTWKTILYSEIREAKYSKSRIRYLTIRTNKSYDEYVFLFGIENPEEFLADLKSKIGGKYIEDKSAWKKISNYIPF